MRRPNDPSHRAAPARGLAVLLVLVGVAGLTGCDRRVERFVPLEEEPPAVETPVRIPGLGNPAPRERVAPPMAPPVGSGTLRGTVRLADGVAPPKGVLFVIARSQAGGPPIAVRRLPAGPFPVDFVLGPQDGMMPGQPLTGPLQLTARLDSDGDPMTRLEGDLNGSAPDVVEAGATGIELILR